MTDPQPLRLGSLFSGVGGFELGLEMTGGFQTVWQVENSAWCRRVLAKHWPDVPRFEVRDVGAHNLPPVDVLCGGFPCQDISVAGKGAGIIEGKQSGLWREYARIIGELRPRYAIVENTPALFVRGIDVVCGTLAALGYGMEWRVISAKAVGAPHLRERVFLVAKRGGEVADSTRLLGNGGGDNAGSNRKGRRGYFQT